ncbi:MAG: transcription elongation factor GreA [Patescibacteria group bacterium]
MDNKIITQEGYDKLRSELDLLTTVKRREIAERIEKAKELGDLSENAEYSEAKDAQALNEGRILELMDTIKNVEVFNDSSKERGKVGIGSTVKVLFNGKEKEFTIVSFNEADPIGGKISNESPLGTAFLGKKKNDVFTVITPRGEVEYKIIDIK